MTKIYFVRHAEPNYNNHDNLTRELTTKGWNDRQKVADFLKNKNISKAFSSPYKRSIDTISKFTEEFNLEISEDFRLRERKIGDSWIDNFDEFSQKQWEDFSYKLENGECLKEVQERNISAISEILEKNADKNIVIGTHGTALSTIINFYDKNFNYKDFERIVNIMPWIVCLSFEKDKFLNWQEFSI